MSNPRESVLGFITSDIQLGLVYCSLAKAARPGSEIEQRNARQARQSYNAVRSFLAKMPMTATETTLFQNQLERLRQCLESLDSAGQLQRE